MSLSALGRRGQALSSPQPDGTAPPVARWSTSISTYSLPKRKRRNSSSGGSQDTKRRRGQGEKKEKEEGGELWEKYEQLDCLGDGGYGSVFRGYRREDLIPVAIKYIPADRVSRTAENIPLEVELMVMVGRDQSVAGGTASFPVHLLDWYELPGHLVLVMERPAPCSDLFDYIEDRGCLQEEEARVLLRQLVEGMIEVHSRGVLHSDLKPENILVQTSLEGPRLRLVDFGCGCVLGEGPYTEFLGTTQFPPPECFTRRSYQAESCTVWQRGVILFDMLCGRSPFESRRQIITKMLRVPAHLSRHEMYEPADEVSFEAPSL